MTTLSRRLWAVLALFERKAEKILRRLFDSTMRNVSTVAQSSDIIATQVPQVEVLATLRQHFRALRFVMDDICSDVVQNIRLMLR